MTTYKNSCIAIGNFDGIHKGHDLLIRDMIEISKQNNLNSMILTFKFSDSSMRKSPANMKYITSFENKMSILDSYNTDHVCYLDIDSEISKYSSEMFIRDILIEKYDMKHIVVGYNFRFGQYALGNTHTLKKLSSVYNYDVSILPRIRAKDNLDISSSIIRDFIKQGKISKANELLAHKYTLFANELEYIDNNSCILYSNSGIITPCDGKYDVLIDEKVLIIEITTVNDNKIIKSESDLNRKNMVFLKQHY
jgi:riboflavin kinase/FMN adenylyltransferase